MNPTASLEVRIPKPERYYLHYVDALSCDMTQEFILFIKMSAEHLCRLIHGVFNLDGNTSAGLGLLHDLPTSYIMKQSNKEAVTE